MNGPLGYGGSMNCKEFEKNIPDFISGKLDFLTLQEFGEHMEKCPGCKEELVIQFLVTEGMQQEKEEESMCFRFINCSQWLNAFCAYCRQWDLNPYGVATNRF